MSYISNKLLLEYIRDKCFASVAGLLQEEMEDIVKSGIPVPIPIVARIKEIIEKLPPEREWLQRDWRAFIEHMPGRIADQLAETEVAKLRENFTRASGKAICEACHRTYSKHPPDKVFSYLTVVCGGKRVKL